MSDLLHARVIDPRVNINDSRNKTYGIYNGGQNQTWLTITSTTFNNSQISWTANPPSEGTYVTRKIWCEMSFRITFTGTSAGPGIPLLQASGLPFAPGVNPGTFQYDAPRCCPLSEAQNTLAVHLNNDNLTSNINTYSRIYQRFKRPYDEENLDLSLTPAMSDKSLDYDDLLGFNLNPLASYGDNVVQIPRGGYSRAIITRNDSTGAPGDIAIVEMTVCEPLWMSPFVFGRDQEELALIGIDNINIQLTLGGRGNGVLAGLSGSLWSHAPSGSVLSAVSSTVLGGNVYLNFISPDMTQQIPRSITYSYFEPTLYPTTTNTPLAPGQRVQLVMNNVQLPSIPNLMYIWADERNQDFDMTKTNSYLRIENLSVTFQNQDGLFANASPYDLYQMSLENGLKLSFDQYNQYVGGALCVMFGKDLPLNALSAPGLRGSQNLYLKLTVTNQSSRVIVPQLNVLVVQEGVMQNDGGSIHRNIGVLSQEDIYASKSQAPISYKPSKNVFGSGFWDDVGSFFKRIVRPAIGVAEKLVPGQFQPIVQGVSEVAKSYGLGLGRRRGGAMLGGTDLERLI
jgi:hypothetical protein